MTVLMLVAALTLAVAVAIRSTWSPCGVSMLSTLTPMSERARGHRYWVTCLWYAAGGTLGGLALGALAAAPAALVEALTPAPETVAVVIGVVALAALATDLRITPLRLPGHTRQVDEVWITKYRRWIYAGGFGAQIGFGFATVFMTGALYLLAVVMVLTGSPLAALLIGGLFGLVRGAAIVAGFRLDTPARLRAFHRRFEQLAPVSIGLVVVVEAAVIVAAAATVGHLVTGLVVAGVPLTGFVFQQLARRGTGAPTPLTLPIAVTHVPTG